MKNPSVVAVFTLVICLPFCASSEDQNSERIYLGKPLSEVTTIVRSCSPRREHPEFNSYLNNLDIKITKTDSVDNVYTNTNLVFRGCGDQVKYAIEDVHSSLKIGLSCLAQLSRFRKKDAARLAALIDPNQSKNLFSVRCGSPHTIPSVTIWNHIQYASGSTQAVGDSCVFMDFPRIVVDYSDIEDRIITGLRTTEFNPQRDLNFHELLHTLGYMHTDRLKADVPVDAQACCFMNNVESCEKLKDFSDTLPSN